MSYTKPALDLGQKSRATAQRASVSAHASSFVPSRWKSSQGQCANPGVTLPPDALTSPMHGCRLAPLPTKNRLRSAAARPCDENLAEGIACMHRCRRCRRSSTSVVCGRPHWPATAGGQSRRGTPSPGACRSSQTSGSCTCTSAKRALLSCSPQLLWHTLRALSSLLSMAAYISCGDYLHFYWVRACNDYPTCS